MSTNGECQPREFGFSEAFIREGRRMMVVLFVFMIPFILAVTLFIPGFQLRHDLPAIGVFYLCLGVILVVQALLINRRQRKLRVVVEADKLVKQAGKKKQTLLWDDLEKIRVVEKKSGGVAQISFYRANSKIPIYLCGFSEMEDLAGLVEQNAPDGISIQHKSQRLDWRNPFVPMFVSGLPTMVVMCVISWMGPKAMDIFALVCALSAGLGILAFRPLVRFDFSYKWLELLAGLVLLAMGIYVLTHFLLFGEMP